MTSVSLPGFPRPIDERILKMTKEWRDEFPFNLDSNSGNQLGIGWSQSTVNGGRRASSATSYLAPRYINRPNIHVVLHAQVLRLLLSGPSEFRKVQYMRKSSTQSVSAKKEVTLSAGVFGTPHILLHSGIGDKRALSALGFKPLHHLPDVGKNISDHCVAPTHNSTDTFEQVTQNATLLDEYLNLWKRTQTGYLAGTPGNHWGWFRLPANSSIFSRFRDPSPGTNTAHFELYWTNGIFFGPTPRTGNYMSINAATLTPLSRGSVTINSSDPLVHPIIDPAILQSEFDIYVLREAIRTAHRSVKSPTWKGYVLGPAGDLASIDVNDDEQLNHYIRSNGGTGVHAVGTAAMSPRGIHYGVTDPDLRVKGIDGFRIIDASILPFVPSAHTQAPTYIVAERGVDLIKETWGLRKPYEVHDVERLQSPNEV